MGRRRARIEGLLKERDARLGPQSAPKEQRGVDGGGQDGSRHGLRGVVSSRKLIGGDLEMHLKARVAGLEHRRIMLHVQFVDALDLQPVRPAAHLGERLVQCIVAGTRRDVVEGEIGLGEAGQDAGEDDLCAVSAGYATRHFQAIA
jgi:hypothetical protein